MASKPRRDNLKNALAMAENIMNCPSNELHMAHFMEYTAQAIRDLVDAIKESRKP